MLYDHERLIQKLNRWENDLKEHTLPSWEELPTIDLYMDQVISILTEYLLFLPKENGADTVVTAAAVNNYVRKKVMPPPVKKKYGKVHLAYLIIICTLKQCVSISYIQRMLPLDLPEEEIHAIYDEFAVCHLVTCQYFIRQMHEVSGDLFPEEGASSSSLRNLVTSTAVVSGLTRMMAESLLLLQKPSEPAETEK